MTNTISTERLFIWKKAEALSSLFASIRSSALRNRTPWTLQQLVKLSKDDYKTLEHAYRYCLRCAKTASDMAMLFGVWWSPLTPYTTHYKILDFLPPAKWLGMKVFKRITDGQCKHMPKIDILFESMFQRYHINWFNGGSDMQVWRASIPDEEIHMMSAFITRQEYARLNWGSSNIYTITGGNPAVLLEIRQRVSKTRLLIMKRKTGTYSIYNVPRFNNPTIPGLFWDYRLYDILRLKAPVTPMLMVPDWVNMNISRDNWEFIDPGSGVPKKRLLIAERIHSWMDERD